MGLEVQILSPPPTSLVDSLSPGVEAQICASVGLLRSSSDPETRPRDAIWPESANVIRANFRGSISKVRDAIVEASPTSNGSARSAADLASRSIGLSLGGAFGREIPFRLSSAQKSLSLRLSRRASQAVRAAIDFVAGEPPTEAEQLRVGLKSKPSSNDAVTRRKRERFILKPNCSRTIACDLLCQSRLEGKFKRGFRLSLGRILERLFSC